METGQDKWHWNRIPSFFSPLSYTYSHILSHGNVTSLEAFHSVLSVPARRDSVKPISIRKWNLFLSSFPLHLVLFIFLKECIWAWMKAYIYQQGHLSTYLREREALLQPIWKGLEVNDQLPTLSQWKKLFPFVVTHSVKEKKYMKNIFLMRH